MSGTAPVETPDQALARAQAAAQARRFGEAAGICNDVLAASPDNPPALALLGVIAAHTNDPERGIALLESAVTAQARRGSLVRQSQRSLSRGLSGAGCAGDRAGGDPARSAERGPSGESLARLRRCRRSRTCRGLPAACDRPSARPCGGASRAGAEPAGARRFRAGLAGIRVAQSDRGREDSAAGNDVSRLERHAHPEWPSADGRRPGLRRHDPVRPLHPDAGRTLRGTGLGL